MNETPLAGMTFRIASRAPAAALASYLLADLGATVLTVPADAPADVVDLGADAPAGAVVLSPYGARGRFAAAPDHHSAVEAVGGALLAQYTYTPGPAYLVSPYSVVGQALLATAAMIAARLGGARPPLHVSSLHGLLAVQAGHYCFGAEPDPQRFAFPPRGQTPVYSTYRAADDWLFIGASTMPFTIKVLQAVGLEDVLDDPRFHDNPRPLRNPAFAREIWERMDPLIRRHPRDHWLALFEELKVPAGPALSMEEALAHPHLRATGLAEAGEPIGRLQRLVAVDRAGEGRPHARRADGPLPLSGLRVVELAGYIAGSYVGRLLADLGADVVKIEPPDGDPFRTNGYGFAAWNHGKRGLSLNLREPSGRDRLLSLVAEADVLVTNYRPEALARMAVGRDDLFAVHPGLIHCTVSAFGETGPLAHLQGFDPVVQAFAGIMKRQGGADEPVKPQIAATDYLSGMLGAIGVLAARAAQLQHGGRYVVRTSLLAGALLLNHSAYEDVRAGRAYVVGGRDFKGPHPLNGLHATSDGWLLTVEPDAPPASFAAARRYLAAEIGRDTTGAALARLAAFGVRAVPCIDPEAMTAEPHFLDNGMWLTVEQPELGTITMPAPVLGPADDTAPAPQLGEHNGLSEVWRTDAHLARPPAR